MGYFVDGFDTKAKRACVIWARDDYDSGDPWGFGMSWLFDLCGELYERGAGLDALYECQYVPGAGGPDVSEDRAEGLAEMSDAALIHATRVMKRFTDRADARGDSY